MGEDLVGRQRWDTSTVARDSGGHAAFLEEAARAPHMVAAAQRSLELLDLAPGQRVLEVGCGTGYILPALAEAVAPEGHVVGVDLSPELLGHARDRVEAGGLSGSVTLAEGDANALEFDAASFDAARTERVLMHQDDPNQQLAEMARVVQPGGVVVALEPDFGCFHLDGVADPDALQSLWGTLVAGTRGPRVGIELYRRMHEVGLVDRQLLTGGVVLTDAAYLRFARWEQAIELADEQGSIDRDRATAAVADLEDASERGVLACLVSVYVGAGRVPQ